jgi:hypothetical protein
LEALAHFELEHQALGRQALEHQALEHQALVVHPFLPMEQFPSFSLYSRLE